MMRLFTLLVVLAFPVLLSPALTGLAEDSEENDKPSPFDELTRKTFEKYRDEIYFLAKGKVEKATFEIELIVDYVGTGRRGKSTARCRWEDGKSSFVYDDGSQVAGLKEGDITAFFLGPFREEEYSDCRLSATKEEGRSVLVTSENMRKDTTETFRFDRKGILIERTFKSERADIVTKFEHTKVKGKLVLTAVASRDSKEGDESTLVRRYSWSKVGKFLLPDGMEMDQPNRKTRAKFIWSFSSWKVNRQVR